MEPVKLAARIDASDLGPGHPRPECEMEQVSAGASDDRWDTDPIIESSELKYAGQSADARKLLDDTVAPDPRCLDAHAHLGHLVFDRNPRKVLLQHEVGVRIGELSLGSDFYGVLPWGLIDLRELVPGLSVVSLIEGVADQVGRGRLAA
jgi:hypothetical protein